MLECVDATMNPSMVREPRRLPTVLQGVLDYADRSPQCGTCGCALSRVPIGDSREELPCPKSGLIALVIFTIAKRPQTCTLAD